MITTAITERAKEGFEKFIKWLKAKNQTLQKWIKLQNFKAAVRKANYLQAKTFKIHLVYLMDGRFVVVERQELKRLYHAGKFKRGMNLRDIENAALYKTKL